VLVLGPVLGLMVRLARVHDGIIVINNFTSS
jgi:hypothetical protein